MAFQFNEDITNNILNYLEGWELKTEDTQNKNEVTSFLSESETDNLNVSKEITVEELETFWVKTLNYAESYLQVKLDSFDSEIIKNVIQTAMESWCAGLIYRKYNIRVIDQVDETQTTGYGDELIIQAKSILKPYQYKKLVIW
ncbi:hypothetical protein [Methanobrevibacter woesei]|uniref:hypothetical protein n=1 Tax=Methanobrevibacter woesei TaxID=190976 RepID=UPI0024B8173C|nr:hypothetical protein [Methanobrevibacter woesei]